MSKVLTCNPKPLLSLAVAAVMMTGAGVTTLKATEWQARAAESSYCRKMQGRMQHRQAIPSSSPFRAISSSFAWFMRI